MKLQSDGRDELKKTVEFATRECKYSFGLASSSVAATPLEGNPIFH